MVALPPALATAAQARIVQLSDTHLAADAGVPPALHRLLDGLTADPPDAVALTGDLVFEDPDNEADRDFAVAVLGAIPAPLLVIPGNHDVGFYGEDAQLPARLARFRAAWGGDRFAVDVAGWRVVGANAYLLGAADDEHDRWLTAAVATERPVAVFIHQPVRDDRHDGWEMPAVACAAFAAATAGADVRLVASGHRHRYADRGVDVFAPSTSIEGSDPDGRSDGRPGAVEYRFDSAGTVSHRVLRPYHWAGSPPTPG